MKIVVTGGAGFIGTHLCEHFLSLGHEVVCLDNLLSGSQSNIDRLSKNSNFKFINHDITVPLSEDLGQVDAILHFACPASPNPASPISYMSHPVETMMVCSLGSKNMLDLATANNCQIIFASTSEVYGNPLVHPQTEDYLGNVSSTGPRSCYDEGKRFMESLAFTYYRKSQAKIKVIRIFNTYGPYMRLDDGRFTINLIDSYLSHKPFKMYGTGSATRSFCYIDDLVSGIDKVFSSEAMIGQVVNLGNPTEYTIAEAIKVFESVVGSELTKEIMDGQIDDPQKRQPDIGKAKSLLGWEPKIDFATGIKNTLQYYNHEN